MIERGVDQSQCRALENAVYMIERCALKKSVTLETCILPAPMKSLCNTLRGNLSTCSWSATPTSEKSAPWTEM